ncbi:MAG: DUF1638 domain-containing protein [Pseudomonadota bacterium]
MPRRRRAHAAAASRAQAEHAAGRHATSVTFDDIARASNELTRTLARQRRHAGSRRPGLIIACGALIREIQDVLAANNFDAFDLRAVPATFHNRPERIAPAVDRLLTAAHDLYEHRYVAYAECGTAGALDAVLARHRVERLPGAHCYAVFAGGPVAFDTLADAAPGTFYLTDFLVRHFDALVWRGLGLDRHLELRAAYFGNYTRVLYLAQTDDPQLHAAAVRAAAHLSLPLEVLSTGYGHLTPALVDFSAQIDASTPGV